MIDLVALNPCGYGGCSHQVYNMSAWNLDDGEVVEESFDDDFDDSSYSSNEAGGACLDYNELLDFDKSEDYCMTDMKGFRCLPVEKLKVEIREKMCCKSCTLSGNKKYVKDFLDFIEEYKIQIEREGGKELFGSRKD